MCSVILTGFTVSLIVLSRDQLGFLHKVVLHLISNCFLAVLKSHLSLSRLFNPFTPCCLDKCGNRKAIDSCYDSMRTAV